MTTKETRDELSRKKAWRPPSLLEAPPARPGYKQRWVATSILGQDNPTNWAKRMREGWQPRDPKTVTGGKSYATIEHGKFAGFIGIEGMVLCEMPEEMVNERNEYYAKMTENLMRSVEQDIHRAESPGNPIQKTFKSEVTRGGFKE